MYQQVGQLECYTELECPIRSYLISCTYSMSQRYETTEIVNTLLKKCKVPPYHTNANIQALATDIAILLRDWLNDVSSSSSDFPTSTITRTIDTLFRETTTSNAEGRKVLEELRIRLQRELWYNCSLIQFIAPEHELDKISAAECVLVFHGVKHGHSYMSQECLSWK